MDISKLVNTEALFNLELRNPATDKPLGIVFAIRSASSDEAEQVRRENLDKRLEKMQRAKMIKADTAIKAELRQAAACVASWDWGEHTWGGETPEFSFAKVCEVLSADWVFDQVVEAANNVANFTTS